MEHLTQAISQGSTRLKPSELKTLFTENPTEAWATSKLEDLSVEQREAQSAVDQLRALVFNDTFYGGPPAQSAQRRKELLGPDAVRKLPNKAAIEVSAYFSDAAVMTALTIIITIKVTAQTTRLWDRGVHFLTDRVIPKIEECMSPMVLRVFRRSVDVIVLSYRNWHYLLLGAVSGVWAYGRYSVEDVDTDQALKDGKKLAKAPSRFQSIASDMSGWAVDSVIDNIREFATKSQQYLVEQLDADERRAVDKKCWEWLASFKTE